MSSLYRTSPLALALFVNAGVIALGIVAMLARPGGVLPGSAAMAQMPPIAGGAGLFLMPAQMSPNVWGLYVMDVDSQTIMAYEYRPGEKKLQFAAARGIRWDRRIDNFNTFPTPAEIKELTEKAQQPVRGTPAEPPVAAPGQ